MKPSESVAAFESFVESNGVSFIGITPSEGVVQMLDFYNAVPVEGCSGASGDMLLFQWGTFDWGGGKNFELDVTRQFIESELQDDDAISQLHLTFAFHPNQELVALGEGNCWCKVKTDIDSFRTFVLSSTSLIAVANEDPQGVSISHSYV